VGLSLFQKSSSSASGDILYRLEDGVIGKGRGVDLDNPHITRGFEPSENFDPASSSLQLDDENRRLVGEEIFVSVDRRSPLTLWLMRMQDIDPVWRTVGGPAMWPPDSWGLTPSKTDRSWVHSSWIHRSPSSSPGRCPIPPSYCTPHPRGGDEIGCPGRSKIVCRWLQGYLARH